MARIFWSGTVVPMLYVEREGAPLSPYLLRV